MKLESAILNLDCIIPVELDLADNKVLQIKGTRLFYNLRQFRISPHRRNAILGIEN